MKIINPLILIARLIAIVLFGTSIAIICVAFGLIFLAKFIAMVAAVLFR